MSEKLLCYLGTFVMLCLFLVFGLHTTPSHATDAIGSPVALVAQGPARHEVIHIEHYDFRYADGTFADNPPDGTLFVFRQHAGPNGDRELKEVRVPHEARTSGSENSTSTQSPRCSGGSCQCKGKCPCGDNCGCGCPSVLRQPARRVLGGARRFLGRIFCRRC